MTLALTGIGVPPADADEALARVGIRPNRRTLWNLTAAPLYEEIIRGGEAVITDDGAVVATTGIHTGRSPRDKFVVRGGDDDRIWWGPVNQPLDVDRFEALWSRATRHASEQDLFIQDLQAAADPRYRIGVRVISEQAWHSLFARNLLLRPEAADLGRFKADYTVLDLPSFRCDPARDGVRSETVVALDLTGRRVLIGGTGYAGEIKKAVFTILNRILPDSAVLPMHCSANVGDHHDTALFFGLSGTGKTTLSADEHRHLIGDDEHGWSDLGVFNFEGGCYAKVIRLSPRAEPEIYAATLRFGTVLENVVVDPITRQIDLADASLTENTRGAYPVEFIPNVIVPALAPHPRTILFLAADAFGVLPPISRLSPDQAMYHFLSGYTAQVAGTEVGLSAEPTAVFSACFGHPFLPLHPTVYARLLGERIRRHDVTCYLINTGWSGGAYGAGARMPIDLTRALVHAAIEGDLDTIPTYREPFFGLSVPVRCPGLPAEQLDSRATWADGAGYDAQARRLAAMFQRNFQQFGEVDRTIREAGPPAY